jgi:hypothetical protein
MLFKVKSRIMLFKLRQAVKQKRLNQSDSLCGGQTGALQRLAQ